MDKPNDHSTLSYMRTYIKNKKLNEKPIKLNMKRAETIKHLRKLGHWDSSVDGQKKPKGGKAVKGTSKKRVTIGKEEIAKKRLDEYVKLHVKYINTFDDKGLSKFSTFDSAKKESDKQLDKMADLVEPIAQSLILDYIKKTKGVTKARAQVKSLSNSLKERFDKLPKKKKPAKKEDDVRPVDKDVAKIKKKPAKKEDDVRPVDKDVPKIKPPAKKEDTSDCDRVYESIRAQISDILGNEPYSEIKKGYGTNAVSYDKFRNKFILEAKGLLKKEKDGTYKCMKSKKQEIEKALSIIEKYPKVGGFNKRTEEPAKKATPPPEKKPAKGKSKSQPPTGPQIAKSDRDAYVADFFGKYKQKTNVYKVLKPFDKRLGGKQSSLLVPLDELKKIRKKSLFKLHPDKGGDPDKFNMVNDAFNALISAYKVDGYKSYSQIVREERDAQMKAAQEAAKKK